MRLLSVLQVLVVDMLLPEVSSPVCEHKSRVVGELSQRSEQTLVWFCWWKSCVAHMMQVEAHPCKVFFLDFSE